MCKFGTFFSKIGLGSFFLAIITMVSGWLFLEVNVCIAAMFLMSFSALNFILCMFCNCAHNRRQKTLGLE